LQLSKIRWQALHKLLLKTTLAFLKGNTICNPGLAARCFAQGSRYLELGITRRRAPGAQNLIQKEANCRLFSGVEVLLNGREIEGIAFIYESRTLRVEKSMSSRLFMGY
jgi:hypothetical protein